MKNTKYYLTDKALTSLVTAIMGKQPVVAPVANRSRFIFAEISNADEVRLDYDTTILPPKKLFFPTKQDLLTFDSEGGKSCIDPKEQVLFGVHPHDVKAIDMADTFYKDNHADNNYLANREATKIIASTVQNHYKNAFFGSVCTELEAKGHDALLTKVDGGYVLEVITDKGSALLEGSDLTKASDEQSQSAEAAKTAANDNCPEKLNNSSSEIAEKVRNSFKTDVWNNFSEDCFSCGTCNTVCPTCFCFDVQDNWNLDGTSGTRYRTWDACLVCEFSEISVRGGSENFRTEKADRFRHRFMRKTSYLNDQLGGPACVGCGRCSGGCTANIANPTTIINKIMEQA